MKILKNRIIPVLLYKDRGLYKGVGFRNHAYVGDPINAIKIFNDKEVDELVILDIEAGKKRTGPDFDMLTTLAGEAFMPMAYGGGITDLGQVDRILSIGFEKVVLNTAAYYDSTLISAIAENYGSQSLVISMDVKRGLFGRYSLLSDAGNKRQKVDILDHVKRIEDAGAGEIMITSIDNDGKLCGYDLAVIELVASAVNLPVIASGGARSMDDFLQAKKAGADAMAAGAMFVYKGPHKAVLINYPKYSDLVETLGEVE